MVRDGAGAISGGLTSGAGTERAIFGFGVGSGMMAISADGKFCVVSLLADSSGAFALLPMSHKAMPAASAASRNVEMITDFLIVFGSSIGR
jgi:hypothetical protein